jgi:hypothetical protein
VQDNVRRARISAVPRVVSYLLSAQNYGNFSPVRTAQDVSAGVRCAGTRMHSFLRERSVLPAPPCATATERRRHVTAGKPA